MTDRPTRLILVRHAEPHDDARGRCYGSLDVRLSSAGQRQAAALADALRVVAVDAIFSSPRRRALETAAAIADALSLPTTVCEDLRELDFGELEGRRYDEIADRMPELYERWMAGPTTVAFPGGESFDDLRARAIPAVQAIRAEYPNATSLVVSHAGVCRAIIADVLELAPELIFRLDVGYARATVVDWHDETPVLRLLNGRAVEGFAAGD